MANRLSLQSATCSAFQLQLCRQPHNDNDTKTVSSFGSDCTRAMQNPHTILQPDEASLGSSLFTNCASASTKIIVWDRKRDCIYFLMCECVCVCTVSQCTVQCESMRVWAGEESLLLFCSNVSLLLWGTLHTRHLHVALQLREGQTQVQALDGDQCAPLQRSCHWAHLQRKEEIVIIKKRFYVQWWVLRYTPHKALFSWIRSK